MVWIIFWVHQLQRRENIRKTRVSTSKLPEFWTLTSFTCIKDWYSIKNWCENDVKFVWLRQELYSPLQKGMSCFYVKLSLQSIPWRTSRDLKLWWMAVLQSRFLPSCSIFLTFDITLVSQKQFDPIISREIIVCLYDKLQIGWIFKSCKVPGSEVI